MNMKNVHKKNTLKSKSKSSILRITTTCVGDIVIFSFVKIQLLREISIRFIILPPEAT